MHGFKGKAPAHVAEYFDDLISDQKRDFDRWKSTATRAQRPALLDKMKKRSIVLEAIYDGGTLRGRQVSLSTGKEHFGPEQARAQFPTYFLAENATQEALRQEERQARQEQERNEALRRRAERVEEDYKAKKRARELIETESSSLTTVAVNEEGEPESEDVIGARKRRSVSRSRSVSRARPTVASETSSSSSAPPEEPVFPFTSPSQPYRDPPSPTMPLPEDPHPKPMEETVEETRIVPKLRTRTSREDRGRSRTRVSERPKRKERSTSTTRQVVKHKTTKRVDPMKPPEKAPEVPVEVDEPDIPPPATISRRSLSPGMVDFPVFDMTALPPAVSTEINRTTEEPSVNIATGVASYPSLSAVVEEATSGEEQMPLEIQGGSDVASMSINAFVPVTNVSNRRVQDANRVSPSLAVPSMPRKSAAMMDSAQENTRTSFPLTAIHHSAHSTAIRIQRPEHELRNIDFLFQNVRYGPQTDNVGFYKDFVKSIKKGTGSYGQRDSRVITVKGFEAFVHLTLPERVLHEKEDRWADDTFRIIFGFQRRVNPSFGIKDLLAIHSDRHNILAFPNMRGLGSSYIVLADEMVVTNYSLLHEFTKAGAEKESTFLSRSFYMEADSKFNWRIVFDDSDREHPKTIEGDLFFAVISEKGFHFRVGEHLAGSKDMVTANIDLDIRLIYE